MLSEELKEKKKTLLGILKATAGCAVAFSSGVDSTFLLAAAKEALGDRVLAVTVKAAWVPDRELDEAVRFCEERGIEHVILTAEADAIPGFRENPPDRCCLCKRALFEKITAAAAERGFSVVAEGSNTDDDGDYRPGMRAIRELGVMSPMEEAGLYKADIRRLSKGFGLPTWDKPSFACLASRFAYGESITAEKLGMVEQAEDFLLREGFSQFRVRVVQPAAGGSPSARIEILPDEFSLLMEKDVKRRVAEKLHSLGFSYVSMDLDGYRMGSMNEDHGK